MNFWDKLRAEWKDMPPETVLTFRPDLGFEGNLRMHKRFVEFAKRRGVNTHHVNWQFEGLTWGVYEHSEVSVRRPGRPSIFHDNAVYFSEVQGTADFERQVRNAKVPQFNRHPRPVDIDATATPLFSASVKLTAQHVEVREHSSFTTISDDSYLNYLSYMALILMRSRAQLRQAPNTEPTKVDIAREFAREELRRKGILEDEVETCDWYTEEGDRIIKRFLKQIDRFEKPYRDARKALAMMKRPPRN